MEIFQVIQFLGTNKIHRKLFYHNYELCVIIEQIFPYIRAELWWKYLDSENVWAPPPFTFLDLFERFVSRMKLERKHKAYCRRMQVNEDPNSLESQQYQQIQHQNEIRNEFLAKYKELLLMLLASIEELSIREAESAAAQYNNGMDRNKEEELEELAGCEAGAE